MLIAQNYSLIAAKNPTRAAFRYLGKETNHRDFRDLVGRLSYLYQAEIGTKQRIAIMARNAPAVISAFLAFTNIRCVSIPVDPDLPPDEITEWLKASKATHLAVTDDVLGKAREVLQAARLNLKLIEIERKQGGEYDPVYTAPPDQQPQETDVILQLRTGGNGPGGKPRLVSFNHKQLNHAATYLRSLYALGPNDRMLAVMNWAHPFAFIHTLLTPLLTTTPIVIDHGLEGADFLKFLNESHVTRMAGTPPFFRKVLLACKKEKQPLPKLRSVTVGLGQLPPDVAKVFLLMKIPVAQTYGLTEAVWTLGMQKVPEAGAAPEEKDLTAALSAIPGIKYRVLDPKGDEIEGPDLRVGMLAIMGPVTMLGYYDDEKATKLSLRGTWLYTGDIVALEGDGQNTEELQLKYLGRREDLIESDGRWTSLHKVTTTIKALAGVQDAGAFVTESSKGEKVIAVAVVRGAATPGLNDKVILAQCTQSMPLSLVPQHVVFTDFIPRDAGGNVQTERLRRQFAGIAG